jgi:hypothetical protein
LAWLGLVLVLGAGVALGFGESDVDMLPPLGLTLGSLPANDSAGVDDADGDADDDDDVDRWSMGVGVGVPEIGI